MPHFIRLSVAAVLIAGCAASSAGTSAGAPGAKPAEPVQPGPRTGNLVVYTSAGSGHYRLNSHDSLSMEMPDGSFQRTVLVKTAYLTFSITPGTGRLGATIRLDSMMLDRPNSMFQPLVDSAQGTEWRGTLSTAGRFDSLVSTHPSLFGEQVRTMLNRLMPVLPPQGMEAGRSWTDSSTVPFHLMAGFSASENRKSEYRAGKVEETRGTRSIPIQSTILYSVTGSGSAMGPEIHMEGNGRGTGTHRLSLSGRLLEAQVTDSVGLTLTVPAAGQTVPATLIATYSITAIP